MSGYTLARADGSFLLALPQPMRGLTRPATLIGSQQTTLGGRRITQRVAVKRNWQLTWNRLSDVAFTAIEAYWLGDAHGPGPFLFCEPSLAGAVLVNIDDLSDTVQLQGFHDAVLSLAEV